MIDDDGNLTIEGMRERAQAAVDAYSPSEESETAIMDLIASLHHLHDSLDERGLEWYTLVDHAEWHYQAEAHNTGPFADPPVVT